ncbi:MAG: peptidylprolyl isomerase [Coriobacteriia bacterium]
MSRSAARAIAAVLLVGAVFALQGCAKQASSAEEAAAQQAADAQSTAGGEPMHVSTTKVGKAPIVVIKTSKGDITAELYPADAPNSVASFVELADSGFYDGIKFHRVEAGFVIQVGDPQTKVLSAQEIIDIVTRQKANQVAPEDPTLGTGNPGWRMKAEFNPRKHVDGTLAMARATDPDSAGSQFYICLGPQPSLDNQYTVFGQVIKGLDVVHNIAVGDVITSITVQDQ